MLVSSNYAKNYASTIYKSIPINVDILENELSSHPDRTFVVTLLNSLRFGAHIGYTGPHKPRVYRNLKSSTQHPDVVNSNLVKEINLGRIAGPFSSPPVGVVPTIYSSEWRTIYHLSYQKILKNPYTFQYVQMDDAIRILEQV